MWRNAGEVILALKDVGAASANCDLNCAAFRIRALISAAGSNNHSKYGCAVSGVMVFPHLMRFRPIRIPRNSFGAP